ncbi:MAG: hypothetical protein KC613_03790 [Myxococcales bacterium]|nr:hypothetical protein [Myxococcales bacterium]
MKDYRALRERMQRIARKLPPDLLSGAADHDLLHEVMTGLGAAADDRLLGFYTEAGVLAALEAYGILDGMRHRGYSQFEVRFELEDFAHTMQVVSDGLVTCECKLRRIRGATDPCIAAFQRDFLPELLDVEWLALSDPKAEFSPERPRLPGQDVPGSGLGAEVFITLVLAARRLGLHGLVEVPERFHNAVFYQQGPRFIDPVFQGRFEALADLLKPHTLAEVSWALEEGRVVDAGADDAPLLWAPREQLYPLDQRVAQYFELPAWRRARAEARRTCRPRILPAPSGGRLLP